MPERVNSLRELMNAKRARRAVVCPTWASFQKPCPAAWMINLGGAILLRLFEAGMFIYTKAKCRNIPLLKESWHDKHRSRKAGRISGAAGKD